jgi:hypothetical protein
MIRKGKLARPERFELPTSWFVARHSIQLSYGRAASKRKWRISRPALIFGPRSYHNDPARQARYSHPVSIISQRRTNRSDPKRPADRTTAPMPAQTRPASEGDTAANAGTISSENPSATNAPPSRYRK